MHSRSANTNGHGRKGPLFPPTPCPRRLRTEARDGADTWTASASIVAGGAALFEGRALLTLKLANYHEATQQVEVSLRDAQIAAANATTLTADVASGLWGEPNYLGDAESDEPDVVEGVAPRALELGMSDDDRRGGRLRVAMPAWSVTVVDVWLLQ